jgi:uncharacterized SAM-binding protein YcdF (DUF218 family)
MTLATVLLVVLIAAALARAGRRRTAWAFSLAALTGVVAIGCGPVAGWLLRPLQAAYPAEPSVEWGRTSAIVLLGGGTERVADSGAIETTVLAYGRLVKALELYLACKHQGGGCFILATGGDPRQHGASEAAVYGAQLRKLGVDAADMILEGKSLNTWQNAELSARLLRQHPADRVFLVTSAIHLRRSSLYFAHFGVGSTPVRADYAAAVMSPVPLAYNFALADLAIHEYAGIARYHIYQMLGWNPSAQRPGAL